MHLYIEGRVKYNDFREVVRKIDMQPNNPDSKQPAENPAPGVQPTGRMIQPLSSEDEIRRAAETARAEQPTPSQTTDQSGTPSVATNSGYTNAYDQNTLVTEPIRRPTQVPQPQFKVASPEQSSQTNNKVSKGIFVVIGLIVIVALGIGAYFFLFSNKIAVSDLVQETVQQTTFLRPKQWSPTGSEGGFGDLKGENGRSLSAMTAKESQQMSPIVGTSDAMYEQLRTQLVSQTSVAAIEPAFRNTGEACKTDITFKTEPDRKKPKMLSA
jgi:flagellar basal body-associated protein FliL